MKSISEGDSDKRSCRVELGISMQPYKDGPWIKATVSLEDHAYGEQEVDEVATELAAKAYKLVVRNITKQLRRSEEGFD